MLSERVPGLVIMTNADQGGAVASELSRRIQVAYEWDSFAQPAPRGYRPPAERVEITAESPLAAAAGGAIFRVRAARPAA